MTGKGGLVVVVDGWVHEACVKGLKEILTQIPTWKGVVTIILAFVDVELLFASCSPLDVVWRSRDPRCCRYQAYDTPLATAKADTPIRKRLVVGNAILEFPGPKKCMKYGGTLYEQVLTARGPSFGFGRSTQGWVVCEVIQEGALLLDQPD